MDQNFHICLRSGPRGLNITWTKVARKYEYGHLTFLCSSLDVYFWDNLFWLVQLQCNSCFQDQQSQFRSNVTWDHITLIHAGDLIQLLPCAKSRLGLSEPNVYKAFPSAAVFQHLTVQP